MRFLSAGLLGIGMLTTQFSVADTPASSKQQIGAVQAAVDFCTKVDSKDLMQIERAARTLLPDMTATRVAQVRHTPEYEQAYKTIDSVLKGIAPSDAVRLCAAAAEGRRGERDEPKMERKR